MTKLELTFNPYIKEAKLRVDGHDGSDDLIAEVCGERGMELASWAHSFYDRALARFNDDLQVVFNGIQRDFDFLEDSLHTMSECDFQIQLCAGTISRPERRLQQLRDLFQQMQEESPFPALKDGQLRTAFMDATGKEFEIAVVATMSSGKSTFINAVLGDDLLPARNQATTATIARIHQVDGQSHFSARAYDSNGKLLQECNPLTKGEMEKLNVLDNAHRVEICGSIAGIKSEHIKVVLTDTPGPNNSRTKVHREHTYRLLSAPYKPMILYLLNATQLETGDDNQLLTDVIEAMKSGARQDRDRFIFVLNRADCIDPNNGETPARIIANVQNYLERHGVSNAAVFPADSKLAKVLRQEMAGLPITLDERYKVLQPYPLVIKDSTKHFSDLAPISPTNKKAQEALIATAQETHNDMALALIYTGIPAIELAISEYLDKYAVPAKIAEGVLSFKRQIDDLKVEADEIQELEINEKKLLELQGTLSELEALLDKGEMATQVKRQIQSLSVDQEVEEAFAKASGELFGEYRSIVAPMRSKNMPLSTANEKVKKLKEAMRNLQAKFVADIEKILTDILGGKARQYVEAYHTYVEQLLGRVNFKLPPAAILGDKAHLSISGELGRFTDTRWVKVGERKVENRPLSTTFLGLFGISSLRAGWARFWGDDECDGIKAYRTEDIKDWRSFVDFEQYIDDVVRPAVRDFTMSVEQIAREWARNQSTAFRAFFTKRLEDLDLAIIGKIKERKAALDSAASRKAMIEKNKKNLEWLNRFIGKLDQILEL